MGATESPPCETVVESSGLDLGAGAPDAFDATDDTEAVDTVRTGENVDIADPGRTGIVALAAIAAFFCAIIVSLRVSLGCPVMLLEKPSPGRAATGSAFLGEFGLFESFSNSLCCVASSFAIILIICQYKLI